MTALTPEVRPSVLSSVRHARIGPWLFVAAVAAVVFAFIGPAQFMNALTLGAIYALVALGYTMVYGIIELINFAHGDVFMVGAFTSMFVLTNALGQKSPEHDIVRLIFLIVAAMLITMVVMGVLGVLIERFAYRPLRNAPRLAPLITAIGVSYILQNAIQILFGPSPVTSPQLIEPTARVNIMGQEVSWLRIFIILSSIGLMIALQVFVNRTKLGRAMRSTAQDREAAQLMGVDINRTIAATFFIGSALAGAAGVINGLYFGNIQFDLGFQAGLKAFTAAVLGGIGNITGAALGGFIIGFVEVMAGSFGFFVWAQAFVFAVLIITLVFRPAGLFGQQIGERA
ncbi:MAG: branched-chain amino acid transport system permease protein [Chloroflexota bacterium]|jgi:branched-chain amino acid transport system permease protein|nr:branched-chain amino acid transport system permease protein [Chloroflexota bacterium]